MRTYSNGNKKRKKLKNRQQRKRKEYEKECFFNCLYSEVMSFQWWYHVKKMCFVMLLSCLKQQNDKVIEIIRMLQCNSIMNITFFSIQWFVSISNIVWMSVYSSESYEVDVSEESERESS